MKTPQGDRAFADILLALKEYGMEQVSVACELALEHRTVTAPVILNHIHRLASPVRPVAAVPTALLLKAAPVANCQRYDALLENHHAH